MGRAVGCGDPCADDRRPHTGWSAASAVRRRSWEQWLRLRGGALEYLPAAVLLEDRERTVPARSFSIANAPRPNGLISLLVTRVLDEETSTWVHERLRVGEEVSVSGPYGTFVDDPTSTGPALFLAAGSGSRRSARCSRPPLPPTRAPR